MSTPFDHEATIPEGGHPLLAGRYRVVRRLGAGGMGEVHLVEDLKLDGRHFAVKLLPSFLAANKRAIAGLKREAKYAMELSHPHIVTVRGFEEMDSGQPFLVMDYVDGETLEEILLEREQMSEAEVVRIFAPIAEALDFAHGRGVIHRDMKPSNIMIRRDGTPLIMDFGIARETKESSSRVSGRESTSGTLPYMSPEQLRGKKPEASQDIYSLAATMWECLAGEPPFSRGDLRHQILEEMAELPSDLDGLDFADYLLQGLSKDPADRPESCGALLGETSSAPSGQRAKPSPTASRSPGSKPRSAADLLDLESKVRILQREAKASLDDGEPLPSEYAANFEKAGHFVESAKENKAARLWSDAETALIRARDLYREIRSLRLEMKQQAERKRKAEVELELERDAFLALEYESDCIAKEDAERKEVAAQKKLQIARERKNKLARERRKRLSDERRKAERLEQKRFEAEIREAEKLEADRLAREQQEKSRRAKKRKVARESIGRIRELKGALAEKVNSPRPWTGLGQPKIERTQGHLKFLIQLDQLELRIKEKTEGEHWWAVERAAIEAQQLVRSRITILENLILDLDSAALALPMVKRRDNSIERAARWRVVEASEKYVRFKALRADLRGRLQTQIHSDSWEEAATTIHAIQAASNEAHSCLIGVLKRAFCMWLRRWCVRTLIFMAMAVVGVMLFLMVRRDSAITASSSESIIRYVVGVGGRTNIAQTIGGGGDVGLVRWGDVRDFSATSVSAGIDDGQRLKQISIGDRHAVMLGADGSVTCVGSNKYGQCEVPAGLADGGRVVTEVAAGAFHSVALRDDGAVFCWGPRTRCDIPQELSVQNTIAVSIAAGAKHTVAVLEDGSVRCWGGNSDGQCDVPYWLEKWEVVQVAAGSKFTAALLANGSVVCWGSNEYGTRIVPAEIRGPDFSQAANGLHVEKIAAGLAHVVAKCTNGSVICWGSNSYGQVHPPNAVRKSSAVEDVEAGYWHSLAILADGSVICWGRNDDGQCSPPEGLRVRLPE